MASRRGFGYDCFLSATSYKWSFPLSCLLGETERNGRIQAGCNSRIRQRARFINRISPSLAPVLPTSSLYNTLQLTNYILFWHLSIVFLHPSATMLAPLLLTTALLFMGYTCYSLHIILCKVRPVGIPYFVIPFSPTLFTSVFLLPFVKLVCKVFGLTHHWFILMTFDWQLHQRYEIYRLIGSDIFFTVSPWKVILHVADPDMAVEVLAGKGENGELYSRTGIAGEAMALFGKNVLTVNGAVWQGHRKVAAPALGKS